MREPGAGRRTVEAGGADDPSVEVDPPDRGDTSLDIRPEGPRGLHRDGRDRLEVLGDLREVRELVDAREVVLTEREELYGRARDGDRHQRGLSGGFDNTSAAPVGPGAGGVKWPREKMGLAEGLFRACKCRNRGQGAHLLLLRDHGHALRLVPDREPGRHHVHAQRGPHAPDLHLGCLHPPRPAPARRADRPTPLAPDVW